MVRRLCASFAALLLTGFPSSAGQPNILNNGGFETGLMCYGNWQWSYTGQYYAGDYQFSLSTDAHGGAYSAEISCGGWDCMRAAVISDYIPTAPNQSYTLSLYSKCPAGTSSFIYIPGATPSSQYLTCNGSWASNSMTFQVGSSPWFFFYLFNADYSWLRLDDIVLTYADGTAPQHTVLHPGVRNVGISGQTVTVDGSPFFSMGFVGVEYSDLALAAAAGANTINGLGAYGPADCFNTGQKSYLDTAYELGLTFVPDSTSTADLQVPAVFPTVMQTFAPHLANIVWSTAGEPDLVEVPALYIPAATFVSEYNAAKPYTSLPLTANFQHAYYDTASYLSPYTSSVDIWMSEPYGEDFTNLAHATSLFNSLQPRPIWLYLDAISANLIVPKAYFAVINGVTGIHYFGWDTFKSNSGALAAAQQSFSELKTLNNAIFGPKLDGLVTASPGPGYMASYDPSSDSVFIMAATPSGSGSLPVNFAVQSLAANQSIAVMFENRTITSKAGGFSDTFAGVDRHVYKIHPGATGLSAAIAGTTGPDAARDWKLQVFNTGLAAANSAQIGSLTLTHTGGTVCTASIAPGTFPLSVGSLIPGASAYGDVIINFTRCDNTSKFRVNIALSANAGAATGAVVQNNVRK
jgi:hypothetical protein